MRQYRPFESNSPDKVKERHGRVQAWDQTSMNFLINGLLHDKSAFHIKMKRTRTWSKVDTLAVVTVPTTRAKTTIVLGAISASGLIKVSVRIFRPTVIRRERPGNDLKS